MRIYRKERLEYVDVLLTALVILVLLISVVLLTSIDSFAEDKYSLRPRVNSRMGYYERNIYYIDWMMPLLDKEDSFFFLNPCFVKGDNEGGEFSYGLGYRRLALDNNWILGANLYIDRRKSKNELFYNQTGFGLEALSKKLDFRFNYYSPTTGKQRLGEHGEFEETVFSTYEDYEVPLQGYEAEVGFLVPGISNKIETRVHGGLYSYSGDIGPDINGFTARLDINLSPNLEFGVGYRDDNVFGSDTYFDLTVAMPFSFSNLFQGKNPFEGAGKGFHLGQGTRDIEERMSDVVVRNVGVVLNEVSELDESQSMLYVDNTNYNDPAESGSLSHPYNALSDVFVNPRYDEGIWIYVAGGDGTASGYTGSYDLAKDVTLWGEGYEYLSCGGGSYPIFDGDGENYVLTLSDGNTVMGIQVQNANQGMVAINASVNIHHNKVMDCSNDGINLSYTTPDVFITNIEENLIAGNDDGLYISANGGGSFTANIHNNDASGNYEAVAISTKNLHNTDITISNNTLSGNYLDGLYLYTYYVDTANITISNNDLSGNYYNGLRASAGKGGSFTANIHNNDASGNNHDGIGITTGDFYDMDITISNNDLSENYYYGLRVSNWGGESFAANIHDNDASGNRRSGLYIFANGSESFSANIHNNDASRNYEGMAINIRDIDTTNITISNNTLSENTNDDGLDLRFYENGSSTANIFGNTIIGNSDNGIEFDQQGGNGMTILSGNSISGNYGNGLELNDPGTDTSMNILVSGNVITENFEDGVEVNNTGGGIISVDLGGGDLGSPGYNSIHDNTLYDVDNNAAAAEVITRYNWWGQIDPDSDQFDGDIECIDELDYDPNL